MERKFAKVDIKRLAKENDVMSIRQMYEEEGNSERLDYDSQKQLIFDYCRKHPFIKCNWFVFGPESTEGLPFITLPLDFDGIIETTLNHRHLSPFRNTVKFN